MEASTPMVIFQVMQFFYFLPGVVYSGMSLVSNQYSFYGSSLMDLGQFNRESEKNWFELSSVQKSNQAQITADFNPITLKTPRTQTQLQNSDSQHKHPNSYQGQTNRKKILKKKSDKTEYTPNQKHQDKKSNTAYLNQFRNILPNTIHQILSYIQRKNKSIGIITKLIGKYGGERKVMKMEDESSSQGLNQEISVARFYAYQNHIKNKLSNYVTLQTFKFLCTDQNLIHDSEIFSLQEQKTYNRICRIAILYYLKYEVVCVLMSSKRMQKPKKWEHLRINRKIQTFIKSGFKEDSQ